MKALTRNFPIAKARLKVRHYFQVGISKIHGGDCIIIFASNDSYVENSFPHPFRAADASFLKWTKLALDLEAVMLAAFRENISGEANPTVDGIIIQESPLKFYQDVSIIALTIPGWDQDLFFLRALKEATFEFPLLGTNEPIYRMGEKVGLVLTPESQLEYVRFFFHFVRGSLGHFQIVENPSDIAWNNQAEEAIIREANDLLIPMTYRGLQPDGFFRNTASFLFKDGLVKSDILVAARRVRYRELDTPSQEEFEPGQTQLADEQFLLENLPIKSAIPFDEHQN